MNKRLVIFLLFLAIFFGLYLMPRLAPIRSAILERLIKVVETQGFQLSYQESGGGLWSSLNLNGVDLEGPGLELSIDKLQLRYSLASLIWRELPLSLYLTDVSGSLNYKELQNLSGGGSSAIKLNLKTLELNNAALAFEALPYTLPDFKLDHLAIRPETTRYQLAAQLSTAEGKLEAQGQVSLTPFRMNAQVSKADARIARRWWSGIEGGQASAQLSYDQRGLIIDGNVENGSIRYFQEAATDIRGSFQYQDAKVTTTLSGQTLGGQANLSGKVDIPKRQWSAEAKGEVGLAESLDWLSKNWLPKAAANLSVSGRSEASIQASGWRRINLEGSSLGAGSLLNYPLEDLVSQFSYRAGEGFRLDASSLLAHGPVTATFEPQEAGFIVRAEGQALELLSQSQSDANFILERKAGNLSASGNLETRLERFGRDISSTLQSSLSSEGWQFQVKASDTLGETLTGSFLLSEGELLGNANLTSLLVAQFGEPLAVNLQSSGPLRALNLSAQISAPDTLNLAKGLRLDSNFSGTITATLSNFTELTELLLKLGPFSAFGTAILNKPELSLNYELQETPVSGTVTTLLSSSSGTLGFKDGKFVTETRINLNNPSAWALELDTLTGNFQASYDKGWAANLVSEQGVSASYVQNSLSAELDDTKLSAFDEAFTLNGKLRVELANLEDSLVLDLTALHNLGRLELSKDAELYQAHLDYNDGNFNANLVASYNSASERLGLEGEALDLPINARGQASLDSLDLDLRLDETLQGKLSGTPADPLLELTGPLNISPLAERYQLPVTGILNNNLRLSRDGVFGSSRLEGKVTNLPVSLEASANGWEANLNGTASLYGVDADISGNLYPELELSATTIYGRLQAQQTANDLLFMGSGNLPAFSQFGWTLDEQSWFLEGSLSERAADIRLGESSFRASLGSEGWSIIGQLLETLTKGDSSLQISAQVQTSQNKPQGSVEGSLLLKDAQGTTPFSLGGNLESLSLSGSLAANSLSEFAPLPLALKGQLELNVQLNPLARSYLASAYWLVEDAQTLALTLEGESTEFNATAQSENLTASYQAGSLNLSANGFSPNAYLEADFPELSLTGEMAHSSLNGWQGKLDVASSNPDVSGSITGNGEQLDLNAILSAAGLSAQLSGQLLPRLELAVSSELPNYAQLSGSLSGSFSRPDFQGRLQTKAQTLGRPSLYLAEQTLALNASFSSGLSLTVDSPNLKASLSQQTWQGSINLPFELEGTAHALTGSLSGNQSQPVLNTSLEGPYVFGSLTLSQTGLESTLELSLLPFLKDIPALNSETLNEALATLSLSAQPDLSWQGFLQASASYQGLPLQLNTRGTGQGRNLELSGSAFINGQELPLSLSSSPDASRLVLDLNAFDLAAIESLNPLPAKGSVTGKLNWNSAQTTPLSATIDFQGELATLPLNLKAHYANKTLSATANLENASLDIRSSNFQQFEFSALSSRENLAANLSGQLSLGEVWQLSTTGTLLGEALELNGFYDVQAAQASWQGYLGGASILGSYEANKLDTQISKPAGLLGQFPLELSASFDTQNGLLLETLQASSSYQDQAITLSASGSIYPKLDLTGLSHLSSYSFPISASTTEAGVMASLSYETLDLKALFSPAFSFQEARLEGELSWQQVTNQLGPNPILAQQDLRAELTTSLIWSAKEGFSGSAHIDAETGQASANAHLLGSGNLDIVANAVLLDTVYAELHAQVPQNPLNALSGQLKLESDLTKVLPANVQTSLGTGLSAALKAELMLGGSLASPSLSGPLNLDGLVSTSGNLEANLQGVTLRLDGPDLLGTANLNRQGWQAKLEASQDNLNISNWLEEVDFSTQLDAEQSWGEALKLKLNALELHSQNSSLKGSIELAETWQGQFQADVSLADFKNLNLQGGIEGGLYLSSSQGAAPQLSANLNLRDLSLDGSNAFLNGSGVVTGSIFEPSLTLRLEGSGNASGQILALLEPVKQRYSLSSNLKLAGFQSDLDLLAEAGLWQGSGGLSYGDFGFMVADENSKGHLAFEGRGALNNWRIGLDLVAKTLNLDGNISSLNPNTTGQVALSTTWSANAETALSATLSSISIFNQALDDIRLELDSWQERQLSLNSRQIQAQVSLSPLSWELTNINLPLGKNTDISATGLGTLSEGKLDLSLTTHLTNTPNQLDFSLSYADKQLFIEANDSFLAGQVKVSASSPLAGDWQGDVLLSGLELYGTQLDLAGTLSGSLLKPALAATSSIKLAETQLQGELSASRTSLDFSQALSSPLLSENLSLTGQIAKTTQIQLSQAAETLTIQLLNDQLLTEGRLDLTVAGLRLELNSLDTGLELKLASQQIPDLNLGFQLSEALSLSSLSQGLRFETQAPSSGQLSLSLSPLELELNDFNWQTPYGELLLDGQLAYQESLQAMFNGSFILENRLENRLPFLSSLAEQSFELGLNNSLLTLKGQNHSSETQLSVNLSEQTLALELDLSGETGTLQTSLSFNPAEGPRGTVITEALAVRLPGGNLKLDLNTDINPQRILLNGSANIGNGQLSLNGNVGLAGLLPAYFAPLGLSSRSLSARLSLLEIKEIPWISERLPNLQGSLSGTANLRQTQLIAQVVSPDLAVEDAALPLSLTLTGPLSGLELTGSLARSRLTGTVNLTRAEGLFVLEQFPIQAPAEAWFGNTDVTGSLSGILRFDLPFNRLADSDIRFASEQISLERNGVVTSGDTSFNFINRRFTLDPTTFTGIGTWQGGGVIAENELNLNFSALQADFSPILGLIPPLSPYEPEAFGSVNLEARGSLREPSILLSSPSFNLKLAGTEFELKNSLLQLNNQSLRYQSSLSPVSPLTGALDLSGDGQLAFFPRFDANLSFNAAGNVTIPTLGQVDDLRAQVNFSPAQGWQLSSQGLLGNPFTLEGSLRPLDLRLTGQNLNLRAPQYFLVESDTNVDLGFSYEDRRFTIRGAVTSNQASLSSEEREPRQRSERPRPRVLSLIDFDNVQLSAPRNLVFNANVGTAEIGLDAVLTGTAASPELSGEARSLRGSFRFAGRNFTLEEGIASFQPSRGIYPSLNIRAYSRFEKSNVTRGSTLSFLEPAGPTFDVVLSLTGEVVPLTTGQRSFRIDLEPRLSSDAIVQFEDGIRAITENELYSLLTLGRIEANAALTGEGSVTESVTQSAIDTAIDTFLLSELQKQLAEALDLDIFEIRTTPLSSLITGADDTFGVALRIGSYLSDEVFASYEISNLDNDPTILLSNEFNLRYQLAPLELGLTGRLKLLNDAQTNTIPELGISLSYAFTPLIRLELGADISNAEQRYRFGVSFRW